MAALAAAAGQQATAALEHATSSGGSRFGLFVAVAVVCFFATVYWGSKQLGADQGEP